MTITVNIRWEPTGLRTIIGDHGWRRLKGGSWAHERNTACIQHSFCISSYGRSIGLRTIIA